MSQEQSRKIKAHSPGLSAAANRWGDNAMSNVELQATQAEDGTWQVGYQDAELGLYLLLSSGQPSEEDALAEARVALLQRLRKLNS
jgi:hypothetical protein